MLDITHAAASAAILRHVEEDRLIQGQWHDSPDPVAAARAIMEDLR